MSAFDEKHGDKSVVEKNQDQQVTPRPHGYPDLLRGMIVNRADQVWALDTADIPMAMGVVFLTAAVDWASRQVLATKIAVALESCHAVELPIGVQTNGTTSPADSGIALFIRY